MSGDTVLLVPDQPTELTDASTDGTYVYIEDHEDRAVALLTDVFRDKPRNEGFVRSVAAPVQELEDAERDQAAAFDVDTAVGDQLTLLGKQIGQVRDTTDNDDMRAAVRTRMLINRSNGKAPNIEAIAESLAPDVDFKLSSLPPKAYDIWFPTLPCSAARAYGLLKAGSSAGTRVTITEGGAYMGSTDNNGDLWGDGSDADGFWGNGAGPSTP